MSPEAIPDAALLLRRVHRHFFEAESGRVSSAAFDGIEMSVNWERYATAEETARQDETGNTVGVAQFSAEICRQLGQEVIHDPIEASIGQPANQAHSLVRGKKSRIIKQQLRDASRLVWTAANLV